MVENYVVWLWFLVFVGEGHMMSLDFLFYHSFLCWLSSNVMNLRWALFCFLVNCLEFLAANDVVVKWYETQSSILFHQFAESFVCYTLRWASRSAIQHEVCEVQSCRLKGRIIFHFLICQGCELTFSNFLQFYSFRCWSLSLWFIRCFTELCVRHIPMWYVVFVLHRSVGLLFPYKCLAKRSYFLFFRTAYVFSVPRTYSVHAMAKWVQNVAFIYGYAWINHFENGMVNL